MMHRFTVRNEGDGVAVEIAVAFDPALDADVVYTTLTEAYGSVFEQVARLRRD